MHIITVPITTVLLLAFQFGVWALESWVAMTIWRWHVTPTTWVTLWQLIWANAAISCCLRQYRPIQPVDDKLAAFGNFFVWAVSPLIVLGMAWILR